MATLYPLRFRPLFKQYLWGGRRLETHLGKMLGPGDDYAESWEICDHGTDQSVVDAGPLAGATLAELVREHGAELLGRHHPQTRFPLLLKFLDAARTLSVQVHPGDAQAARLDPPDLGKTEAWVVLAAEPGATIYAGLRPGVDRTSLAEAIRQGRCQELLHQFQPGVGDCVFLPAGTVHALGEGLLVAEIQQASDTTYRLFDWNRVGPDGKPRPLHVEQALEVIDYGQGPVRPQQAESTGRPGVDRLVSCDKFVLDRWRFDTLLPVGGDQCCHILVVLEGSLSIVGVEGDSLAAKTVGGCLQVGRGQTVLLPACVGQVGLQPQGKATLLDAYLP